SNEVLFLSHSAEWVRKNIGIDKIDNIAKKEFLLTGYVTGNETLYSNVRQVRAGEIVRVKFNNGQTELSSYRYYQFTHSEPGSFDESTLRSELEGRVQEAMKRLLYFADGRQIVIPLSGGYDSRLIATIVKEMEYD